MIAFISLGLYGVGKAAVHQPALVILSHTPVGATKTIAWCGKGIVYDTGGLSIKDKVNFKKYLLLTTRFAFQLLLALLYKLFKSRNIIFI